MLAHCRETRGRHGDQAAPFGTDALPYRGLDLSRRVVAHEACEVGRAQLCAVREIEQVDAFHVTTVAATELAMKHLRRPTPNTVLLGAFTAMSDEVRIDSVCEAIMKKFPGKIGEMNVTAARAAHHAAIEAQE